MNPTITSAVAEFRELFWKRGNRGGIRTPDGIGSRIADIEEVESFLVAKIEQAYRAGREDVRKDLLAIADKGEIEALRRGVEGYFARQVGEEVTPEIMKKVGEQVGEAVRRLGEV